ncbi:Imm30 family immunity protein [Nostoc sp.]|uniref:Imm30 family immunity protein n=1 Tax=Nostoc sp. TaxID=1180 RepID=UPI002FF6F9D8
MSENTLIYILQANRLMRSDDEIAAFENALAELANNPKSEYLPELYLVLDDRCQHEEVMFSLVHFLESFEVKEQLQAFLHVLPKLLDSAPEWTRIIHTRILNDELTSALYQEMLNSVDSHTKNVVTQLLNEILKERHPVKT